MSFVINNKMRGSYGRTDTKTNKVEINLKAHKKHGKLDRAELASTVKHELLHVKHPKMTEKEAYKKSRKTKLSFGEQQKLLSKMRMKKINYKIGSAKRKLGVTKKEKVVPGSLINKAKSMKDHSVMKTAFVGLV